MAEQVAIATFLDEKRTEIDALIADVQVQIDALEKYKQSVVYEAVTKGLNADVEMRDRENAILCSLQIPDDRPWRSSSIAFAVFWS